MIQIRSERKRKMKKIRAKSIVAALMAGVMLFGLAGCGAGDSSSGEKYFF